MDARRHVYTTLNGTDVENSHLRLSNSFHSFFAIFVDHDVHNAHSL